MEKHRASGGIGWTHQNETGLVLNSRNWVRGVSCGFEGEIGIGWDHSCMSDLRTMRQDRDQDRETAIAAELSVGRGRKTRHKKNKYKPPECSKRLTKFQSLY